MNDKKRIVFIEPSGNKTNVFDNYMRLPLMGSLYLGTILHNRGYQVRILNENLLGKQVDPFEVPAEVYCITALSVSAGRARFLASQFKKIYPSALVLIGGIHASLMPEEFTDVADHVVTGEAENIIADIVEGKYQEKIIEGSPVEDLDTLPLVNYRLLEGCENLRIVPIMTSRGCPFQCSFCSVTRIFGRKYRMQSPQRILEEIESILRFFRNKGFFFYDDNLTADKKRISELCDLLTARGYNIRWTAQVRADLARDPALVAKMAGAGLRWVYIGFESINDETLKELKKSQTRADIEKSIRTFHDHGVNIHGMFMFGDDHDTEESISQTVQFAIGNGIDTVQFMLLTPLPGTEHYFKIEREQRLLHKDWDYYNGMFVVFRPKNMSPSKLTHETIKAYRKFYSSGRSILDGLSMISTILMDALVWNWGNAGQYDMDIIFKRGGAKLIVDRQTEVSSHYLAYLDTLEREEARKR